RQEQLPLEQRVRRIPLDVEELRIRTALAPFQQVQPPGIIGPADGHVIGNDVQNQPHTVFPQRGNQAAQCGLAAQFRGLEEWIDRLTHRSRSAACWRAEARISSRRAALVLSSKVEVSPGNRRRQLGWLSMVPG
nr:hypothetical protein [Tanacetum cinerariifolium]